MALLYRFYAYWANKCRAYKINRPLLAFIWIRYAFEHSDINAGDISLPQQRKYKNICISRPDHRRIPIKKALPHGGSSRDAIMTFSLCMYRRCETVNHTLFAWSCLIRGMHVVVNKFNWGSIDLLCYPNPKLAIMKYARLPDARS